MQVENRGSVRVSYGEYHTRNVTNDTDYHYSISDYNQACCRNCSIAVSGYTCRPAISTCDITEYCNGTSANCPPDVHVSDGNSCGNGTMYCASGLCTSRSAQCAQRGARLNITTECSFQQDSCQISCEDPSDPNNCLALSGMFLDGTNCGLAGRCQKGQCVSTGACKFKFVMV
jgi:hypothetical protein